MKDDVGRINYMRSILKNIYIYIEHFIIVTN